MRASLKVAAAVAALSLTACASGGVSPHGRYTTIHATGTRLSGELIAVSQDTLWLLSGSLYLSAYRMDALRRIDVRRHEFGARKTFRWMAIAGAATGAALMISCLSYDGSGGCLLLPPAATGVFLIPGSLFALLNYTSAWHFFEPKELDRVRPYARFPQGLPDTIRIARPILAPQIR